MGRGCTRVVPPGESHARRQKVSSRSPTRRPDGSPPNRSRSPLSSSAQEGNSARVDEPACAQPPRAIEKPIHSLPGKRCRDATLQRVHGKPLRLQGIVVIPDEAEGGLGKLHLGHGWALAGRLLYRAITGLTTAGASGDGRPIGPSPGNRLTQRYSKDRRWSPGGLPLVPVPPPDIP